MTRRSYVAISAATVILVALLSGTVYRYLMDIGREDRPAAGAPAAAAPHDAPVVRIGVVSRFAPNLIYAGYQPVIDYLNERAGVRCELQPSSDYRDAVERLQQGDVAASFLGAWITRSLGPESGLRPVIAPRNSDGVATFHDVLIVRDDADIESVADLAGRSVAVPSHDSWAGNWLQDDALPAAGLSVADLDTLRHFDHHQTVVWRVLHGGFDAGVVKESVAGTYLAEGLKIAAVSGPIPGPPLVVRADGDDPVVARIVDLLLALDPADPADAAILAGWTAEFAWGFTPVAWSDYAPPGAGAKQP
jgi:phosphonate transport system substrate-binding protein